MSDKCLICKSEKLKKIFNAIQVPLAPNAPLDESDFDSEIFVELDIVQCQHCSIIYNKAFDLSMIEKIYTENYSSGIPNSPKVLEHFKSIIDGAILKENIENQCVIEIGASDFTFSELLIERGASQVIAFEPSNLFQTENPRIHHINTFFSVEKIPVATEEIGLIVMRHVLEHLPDPMATIAKLASVARQGLKLYIEVPNAEDIIADGRFYDFFYEHITYFNPALLTRIMKNFGFTTHTITSLVQGQHFGLLCEKTDPTPSVLPPMKATETIQPVGDFTSSTEEFLNRIGEVINSYEKLAIYGAGNHGLGVAALLELDSERVKCFLDLNEMKAGKYSPKTHIPIVPPEKKKLQELDAIVIIASLHQDDIAADLRGKFAFTKDIWGTYPDVFKISSSAPLTTEDKNRFS